MYVAGTSESGAFMGNSLLSAIEKIQYDKNISDSNETCAECPEARTINVQNGRGNDIYFVIDVSKSITAEKVKLRGRFLKALLPKLGINNEPVGTRLAFYFFASKCIKDINHHYQEEENIFASYKEAQEYLDDTFDKQKLDDLIGKTGKGTSISNALDDVAQDIHGKIVSFNIGQSTRKAEQVVIVISDGQYNTDGNPKTAADALKETPFHAEIFSILVGADERKYPLAFDTMKEIASTIENEKHFFPIRGDQLHEVIGAMIANGSSLNLPCGQTDPFLTNLENDSIPVYEENAQKGAWPWMAELVDVNGVLTCGGSLIDSQWILTAAHCIVDTAKVILKILKHGDQQGIVSFDKTNENYIIHEKYNINKEEKFAYDIALIKLPYEVKISRSLLPVCLPDENYEIKAGVFGVVTGWGRTHSQGNAREHLKQMQMKIQTCENDEHFNNEIMFCAGSEVEDKRVDVCQGDSGGPFVIRIKNDETRFFQTGIVSHGNGCKKEHGVYTKLSPSLVTWIRTKMNQG
ncbi:peptidase S1 [Mactra antiquata]